MAPGARGAGVKSVVKLSPESDELAFLFVVDAADIMRCAQPVIERYNALMLQAVTDADGIYHLRALLALAEGLKEARDAQAH